MTTSKSPIEILREPFDPAVVKWRPGAKTKQPPYKAIAMAYVDARMVMERFDAAFGPLNWTDGYRLLNDGSVECTLGVREAGGAFIDKTDVGYSNDPGTDKETEPLKAAYSDAFKRAAVKWGVGRDLYETPQFWIDVDDRGRFTGPLPVYVAGKGWQLPSTSAGSSGGSTGGSGAETSTSAATPTAGITEPQRRRIKAALTNARIEGKKLTQAQAKAAVYVATKKNSTTELTAEEASFLIEKLGDQRFIDSLSEVVAVG